MSKGRKEGDERLARLRETLSHQLTLVPPRNKRESSGCSIHSAMQPYPLRHKRDLGLLQLHQNPIQNRLSLQLLCHPPPGIAVPIKMAPDRLTQQAAAAVIPRERQESRSPACENAVSTDCIRYTGTGLRQLSFVMQRIKRSRRRLLQQLCNQWNQTSCLCLCLDFGGHVCVCLSCVCECARVVLFCYFGSRH